LPEGVASDIGEIAARSRFRTPPPWDPSPDDRPRPARIPDGVSPNARNRERLLGSLGITYGNARGRAGENT
jgi:hypothetical protein